MGDIYRHFKTRKEYEVLGVGIFRRPRQNGDFDPLFDRAFDTDEVARQVNVYLGRDGLYVLEDAGEQVHPTGLVCLVYRGQYRDKYLGESPLFVRNKTDFFAYVSVNGYSGPRFICVSSHSSE